jgi:hypothetical protein
MKPVYFPHTYLTPCAADALRKLFASVAVYQPAAGRVPAEMQTLVEGGFLEVVAPAAGDAEDFERLIRDFQDWGRRHGHGAGLEAALRHGPSCGGPAEADGSTGEIASQIRRRLTPGGAEGRADAGLAARVFLQLAQTADEQRQRAAVDMARFDEARSRLLNALGGEDDDPAARDFKPPPAPAEAPDGDDRLERRTAAWARLFLDHPYPSPVFVTHSRDLIGHLAETVPGGLRLSRAWIYGAPGDSFPVPPAVAGDRMAQLAALAAGEIPVQALPVEAAGEEPLESPLEEAHIFVWPGLPPFDFFSRLQAAADPGRCRPPFQAPWQHTVVLQLDCRVRNK